MAVRALCYLLLMVCAFFLAPPRATAQDPAARQPDERAIREVAKAYAAALAKGDAAAVADFWTKDGDYFDEQGKPHRVSELATEVTKSKGATRLENKVTTSKIRFLTADVAVEDGTSEVASAVPGGDPVRGQYHATWVKQDGRWRLASLCELPVAAPNSAVEPKLEDLDWMVGNWVAELGGAKFELHVHWNDGRTFLLRDLKVSREGKVGARGTQRIGWDPLSRSLRSWSFDSDGGYGETTWVKEGDAWIGQAAGVLPDGRQTSSITVMTYDGKDRYTRRVVDGEVDNEPTPDQELTFVRQPGR